MVGGMTPDTHLGCVRTSEGQREYGREHAKKESASELGAAHALTLISLFTRPRPRTPHSTHQMLGAAPQLASAPGVAYLCGDCGEWDGRDGRCKSTPGSAGARRPPALAIFSAPGGASAPLSRPRLARGRHPHATLCMPWGRERGFARVQIPPHGAARSVSLSRPAEPAPPEPCSLPSCSRDSSPHTAPLSGHENELKAGDVIRCRECGYRILYKKRTKRVVQFEAR